MEPRLLGLKRVLDALDVQLAKTYADENSDLVHSAVYLAQLPNRTIPRDATYLGYAFGWYGAGPLSRSLDEDYSDLVRAVATGETIPAEEHLPERILEKLIQRRTLLTPPKGIARDVWLRLVASYDFLTRYFGFPTDKAIETLQGIVSETVPVEVWNTIPGRIVSSGVDVSFASG